MSEATVVGVYELGVENVRLCLSDGYGSASAIFTPNDNGCMIIDLACIHGSWEVVVGGLMHEAMETLLHRRGLAYRKTNTGHEETGMYFFMLSHADFSQCCEYATMFLLDCEKDLKKAWQLAQTTPGSKKRS